MDELAKMSEVQVHQSPRCISGDRARKTVELTPGDLRRCPGDRTDASVLIAPQKSAEGIVGIARWPKAQTVPARG
jgi:hypothetical protein